MFVATLPRHAYVVQHQIARRTEYRSIMASQKYSVHCIAFTSSSIQFPETLWRVFERLRMYVLGYAARQLLRLNFRPISYRSVKLRGSKSLRADSQIAEAFFIIQNGSALPTRQV